jgi:signal transduction histidine kinase
MQLGALRPLVAAEPEAVAERLDHLQEAARRALDTTRRLARDLRPPALDELGLVEALRHLAESLGLRATFDAVVGRLPAAVEVAAYLITAEALHNVARHAGTVDVCVSLRLHDADLVLRVRDRGAGLPADRPAGVGLVAMRERAEELGGSLAVSEAPDGGTEVVARLPARVPDEVTA